MSATDFVAVAAAAGADDVDLHPEPMDAFGLGELVRVVGRTGVRAALISPLPNWYATTEAGTVLPPPFERLAEVAGALGSVVGVPSPLVLPGQAPPREADIAAVFGLMLDRARRSDAQIAIEPVGRSGAVPGAVGLFGTLDAARTFAREHDLDVAFVADSYCFATAGVDLTVPWHAEDVVTVQVADLATGDGNRAMPGDGSLDLGAWLAAAERPPESVGLEVPSPARPGGYDADARASEHVARTRDLIQHGIQSSVGARP